jgi:ubiquitin-conjugating enzyme E2 D/E
MIANNEDISDWEIPVMNNIANSLQGNEGAISEEWFAGIFPNKDQGKRTAWLTVLKDNEFDSIIDLKTLDQNGWDQLSLPLGVKSVLKNAVQNYTITASVTKEQKTSNALITQVDCIVIDISQSMRARSVIDVDKTREDVSKMLFHTTVDKLIALELSHAVGLLAFGEFVHPIGITQDYERFHDELGRLDANESRTALYDAIFTAAEMLEEYVTNSHSKLEQNCKKRIFVLTDGEDNASKHAPWQVAQFLQQRGIILDSIPLAGVNPVLQSMCTATTGLCFHVASQEQGISLFEREATLHVAYREEVVTLPPRIEDMSILKSLENRDIQAVVDVKSAVPKSAYAPVLSASNVTATIAAASAPGSRIGASAKRILREYTEVVNNSSSLAFWKVYMTEDNIHQWKAVMSSTTAPYEGGNWMLTIDFPSDYPFRPPRVRFITPIYHCNISGDGHICLDILKDCWNPALSIVKVFLSIEALLCDPNAMDPLDAFKAQLYRDDKVAYMVAASRHTLANASSSIEDLEKTFCLHS